MLTFINKEIHESYQKYLSAGLSPDQAMREVRIEALLKRSNKPLRTAIYREPEQTIVQLSQPALTWCDHCFSHSADEKFNPGTCGNCGAPKKQPEPPRYVIDGLVTSSGTASPGTASPSIASQKVINQDNPFKGWLE